MDEEITIKLTVEQIRRLKLELYCCYKQDQAEPNPRPTYRKELEELIEVIGSQTKGVSIGQPPDSSLPVAKAWADREVGLKGLFGA